MKTTPKYSQKNFSDVYSQLQYAGYSSLGKHFAWILRRFYVMMNVKQKIFKKYKDAPKGGTMKSSSTRPLGKFSRMILHIELPLGLGAALFFLFSYLKMRIDAPVYAAIEYAPLVTYLFFPFIITAFSVLLIERLERE